jgi:hypothetical protein
MPTNGDSVAMFQVKTASGLGGGRELTDITDPSIDGEPALTAA